jgi:hypothetical protein
MPSRLIGTPEVSRQWGATLQLDFVCLSTSRDVGFVNADEGQLVNDVSGGLPTFAMVPPGVANG